MDALIADEIATPKKNIVVCELGKEAWTAAPPPAIRRRPLRFETVTLHVDRAALDARLFDHASALGTAFIWERVISVDTAGERVTGCSTAAGRRVEARWYIDASGTARVLSRAMAIPDRLVWPPEGLSLDLLRHTAPVRRDGVLHRQS